MNRATFQSDLVRLCASALAAGIIDLPEFEQRVGLNVKAAVSPETKTRVQSKPRRYSVMVKWTEPMIRLAVQLYLRDYSWIRISIELEKQQGVRCTDGAVASMIYNLRSGYIFKNEKYRKEPMQSFMIQQQQALQAARRFKTVDPVSLPIES
jgi:hypothetical protein